MKFNKGDRLYYKMNPSVKMYVMDVEEEKKMYHIEDTIAGQTRWHSQEYIEKNFEKE